MDDGGRAFCSIASYCNVGSYCEPNSNDSEMKQNAQLYSCISNSVLDQSEC